MPPAWLHVHKKAARAWGTGGLGRGGTQQIKAQPKQYRCTIWAEARLLRLGRNQPSVGRGCQARPAPVLPALGAHRRRKVSPRPTNSRPQARTSQAQGQVGDGSWG